MRERSAWMPEGLFEELKRYVGFEAEDERRMQELGRLLEPQLDAVVDAFYARIEEHAAARAVIRGGSAQIERLKHSLRVWLRQLFRGPWDETYFDSRSRIGRKHVEVGLAQHYNFTAINVVRTHLNELAAQSAPTSELARLRIASINRMLDLELAIMLRTYREDTDARLQRNERLATFGLMMSTIGHELRNPLGVIESSAYLLGKRVGEERNAARHVRKIQEQVARSNRIITSLLDIVRERPPGRVHAAPNALAERAASELLGSRRFGVELMLAAELPRVLVDPDQLLQVLVNLLENAVDAAGSGGRVRLSTRLSDHGEVEFVVNDSGPGVAAEVEARMFEPLVTTKQVGVGLGLALCRKVVDAHGGTIELIEGEPLSGAAFSVRLAVDPPA